MRLCTSSQASQLLESAPLLDFSASHWLISLQTELRSEEQQLCSFAPMCCLQSLQPPPSLLQSISPRKWWTICVLCLFFHFCPPILKKCRSLPLISWNNYRRLIYASFLFLKCVFFTFPCASRQSAQSWHNVLLYEISCFPFQELAWLSLACEQYCMLDNQSRTDKNNNYWWWRCTFTLQTCRYWSPNQLHCQVLRLWLENCFVFVGLTVSIMIPSKTQCLAPAAHICIVLLTCCCDLRSSAAGTAPC